MTKHNNEIEALTGRFRDYIDRVQELLSEVETKEAERPASGVSPEKLYTVISPVNAMAENLKSVMKAIESAMKTLDSLSEKTTKHEWVESETSVHEANDKDVYVSTPGRDVFTREELEYLMDTFNTLMNKTEKKKKESRTAASKKNIQR